MKVELTNVQRQILHNQYQILSMLDEENNDEYEYKMKILYEGYERDYSDVINVFSNESITDYETCQETSDILNMNRIIQSVISKLSNQEKEELELSWIEFDGFDANNDKHYSYAKHQIDSGKWAELRGKELNSHTSSSIRRYRKMLPAFNQCMSEGLNKLGASHINHIIEAAKTKN